MIENLTIYILTIVISFKFIKYLINRNVRKFVHPIKGQMNGDDPIPHMLTSMVEPHKMELETTPPDRIWKESLGSIKDKMTLDESDFELDRLGKRRPSIQTVITKPDRFKRLIDQNKEEQKGESQSICYNQYQQQESGIYYKWYLWRPIVQITNFDAIKYVLRDKSDHFGRFWATGKCPIIMKYGRNMKRVFRIYTTLFNDKNNLSQLLPVIQQEAGKMVDFLHENQGSLLDSNSLVPDLFINLLSRIYIGSASDSHKCIKANYFLYNKDYISFVYHVFPWLKYLPTKLSHSYDHYSKYRNIFQFSAMKAYYSPNDPSKPSSSSSRSKEKREVSLLTLLSDVSYSDNEGLALEEMKTSNFIINSSSICGPISLFYGCLIILMKLPHVQKLLVSDINRTLESRGRQIEDCTLDDIGEMKYLDSFLRETSRLYPPYPSLMPRFAKYNERILGYRIPSGTIISCPIAITLRDPENFIEPNKFVPERFNHMERDKLLISELGWGFGTRKCLAKKLSKLILKVVIINLVTKFQFESTNINNVVMRNTFSTFKPEPSILFRVTPRNELTRSNDKIPEPIHNEQEDTDDDEEDEIQEQNDIIRIQEEKQDHSIMNSLHNLFHEMGNPEE